MIRALPFLMSRIFNTPLMVVPARLDAFLTGLPALLTSDMRTGREGEGDDPTPRQSPGYTIRNGVATLPVHGVLVRRAGQMTPDCQPLMSYEVLSKRLRGAMRDPRVHGVLLDLDTPGGEAGAVLDLAHELRAASRVKPVWAIANDDAFSAGYALASGASRVWTTRSGGVGSIGVVALHADQSQYDAKEGLRYSYIHAGARKVDGHPHAPLSPEAHARIQSEVDRLHALFVETVAAHRGLPHEHVAGTEAGLYFGPEAIRARLADQVGTPEEAEAALAAHVTLSARRPTMSDRPESPASAEHEPLPVPEEEPQSVVVAFAGGQQQERARVVEIVELCAAAGHPLLAAELVRNGMTIEQVRRHLIDLAAAAAAPPIVPISTEAGPSKLPAHVEAFAQRGMRVR